MKWRRVCGVALWSFPFWGIVLPFGCYGLGWRPTLWIMTVGCATAVLVSLCLHKGASMMIDENGRSK